jgi:hypothetical protein
LFCGAKLQKILTIQIIFIPITRDSCFIRAIP